MREQDVTFRAGVGVLIYRGEHVALFERHFERGNWQFPQGGLEYGETPEQALWRELKEETGLQESDFVSIHPVPFLTNYIYPQHLRDEFVNSKMVHVGQTQFWFMAQLKGDVGIDLEQAEDEELSDCKWVSVQDMVESIIEWKQDPYKELLEYFQQHIK